LTTIRKQVEQGTVDERLIAFFESGKGNTPLCCHNVKKTKTGWLVTCDWIKTWHPPEEFKTKCLECQKMIAEKLRRQEENAINGKDELEE